MKKYISIFLGLCFAISMVFMSCSKDNKDEIAAKTFQVVKTIPEFDQKGGTITVEFDGIPQKASSDVDWITVKIENNKVIGTITRNDTPEVRTGLVSVFGCDGTLQKVPVTQLGIISIINVKDYKFNIDGGTTSFYWDSDDQYEITDLPEWISYEIKGKEISFIAKSNENGNGSRNAIVHIYVGKLIHKVVKFSQNGPLPIEALVGKYQFSFSNLQKKVTTVDVNLEKVNDNSLLLKGIDFPINLIFDKKTNMVYINCQLLDIPQEDKQYALNALNGDKDDIGYGYNVNWGVSAKINDMNHIVLDFTDNGNTNGEFVTLVDVVPTIVRGFVVLEYSDVYHFYDKSKYNIMLDLKLEKIID